MNRLRLKFNEMQNNVKVLAFVEDESFGDEKVAVKFTDGPLSPIREESSRDLKSNQQQKVS